MEPIDPIAAQRRRDFMKNERRKLEAFWKELAGEVVVTETPQEALARLEANKPKALTLSPAALRSIAPELVGKSEAAS